LVTGDGIPSADWPADEDDATAGGADMPGAAGAGAGEVLPAALLAAAAKRAAEAPGLAAADEGGARFRGVMAPRVAATAGAPPPPGATSWPCARGAGFQLAPKPDDQGALPSPWGVSLSHSSPECEAANGSPVADVAAEPENPAFPAGGTIRSGTWYCPSASDRAWAWLTAIAIGCPGVSLPPCAASTPAAVASPFSPPVRVNPRMPHTAGNPTWIIGDNRCQFIFLCADNWCQFIFLCIK